MRNIPEYIAIFILCILVWALIGQLESMEAQAIKRGFAERVMQPYGRTIFQWKEAK